MLATLMAIALNRLDSTLFADGTQVSYADCRHRAADAGTFVRLTNLGIQAVTAAINVQDENDVRDKLGKKHIGQGMLAAVSLKLSWWQGNHHVGQGTWDGFSCKVWTFLTGAPQSGCTTRLGPSDT